MNNERQPRRINTSGAYGNGSAQGSGRKINRSGTTARPGSSHPVASRPSSTHPNGARPSGSHSNASRSASGRPQPQAPVSSQTGNRRRKKKKGGCLRTLLTALVSLLLVVALILTGVYAWISRSLSPDAGMPSISQIVNTPSEYKGDVVNILVAGIREGLTDMIMYVNFDVANKKINMLQIPRDVYPGEEYKTGGTGKINAVSKLNGGIPTLVELVHEQYKLPIDYYLTIDIESLREIVDLFGGIDVYVPREMDYQGSHLDAGMQRLNGNAVEFFVRTRHGDGYAQGDLARLDMQRYFYQGLFDRVRTATVWDIAKLAPVALKYIETDIPMSKLISIGVSFLKVNSANIMMCKMPTYSATELYAGKSAIQVCDVAKTTDLLNQYFRTYGGPVSELAVPTRATRGSSSDANIQYMGQLDNEANPNAGAAQPAG